MKILQTMSLVILALSLVNCSSKPKKTEEVKIEKEASVEEKDSKEVSDADLELEESDLDSMPEPSVFLDEGGVALEEVPMSSSSPVISSVNATRPGYIIVDESAMARMPLEQSPYFESDSMTTRTTVLTQTLPTRVMAPVAEGQIVELQQPASSVVSVDNGEPGYRIVDLDLDAPAGGQAVDLSDTRAISSFKNGYYSFISDCNIRSQASKRSTVVGQVNKGKVLWVDGHTDSWAKVYRKAGPAYVSRKCF